jgi:flavin-dependent dehydrogenase
LSNLCFIVAARDVRERGSDAARVMREVVASNRRAALTLRDARVESAWLAVALEGFGRFRVAPARGLLSVGDAASFIDPFTGSGMLMALESGELAATTVARHLAQLRADDSSDDARGKRFDALACEYRDLYRERFGARLRVCSYVRRAAFAPRTLVELGVAALGASAYARRTLALATRGGSKASRVAGNRR